jgi:hypothetical protein
MCKKLYYHQNVRNGSVANTNHLKWIPEILPGGIMKLTTHLHLPPKLAMSGATPLLLRYASMAWTREYIYLLCIKHETAIPVNNCLYKRT